MMIRRILAPVLLLTVFCGGVAAQAKAVSSIDVFPLSQVKEGMRGTARTVFRGSEPEEFNVEILGVLPGGIGPKQDLIVGRLSGAVDGHRTTASVRRFRGRNVRIACLHRRKTRRSNLLQLSVLERAYMRNHADRTDDLDL